MSIPGWENRMNIGKSMSCLGMSKETSRRGRRCSGAPSRALHAAAPCRRVCACKHFSPCNHAQTQDDSTGLPGQFCFIPVIPAPIMVSVPFHFQKHPVCRDKWHTWSSKQTLLCAAWHSRSFWLPESNLSSLEVLGTWLTHIGFIPYSIDGNLHYAQIYLMRKSPIKKKWLSFLSGLNHQIK